MTDIDKGLPRVILHADDLGFSPPVNAAIARAIERGLLTSVSVMANGAAFEEGIDIARSRKDISVGVHLNATEFAPLTTGARWGSLRNAAGEFQLPAKRWLTGAERQVFADEWCAQVRRVLEQGVRVSHLDSHHHVHTLPMLFPVLKAVMAKTGIHRVRNTRNFPMRGTSGLRTITKRWSKDLWSRALKHTPVRARCTELFGSVTEFVAVSQSRGPRWCAGRVVEVMSHPGHPGAEYQEELRVLEQGLTDATGVKFERITYFDI